ncbi:hypothetical protein SCACP_10600 [Sporomusa carbonis]|uniref:HD domain-containing protein n=1 Tax=Sporomusa carbonis TaxID=3076075 RepID=UPI003A703082
MPYLLARWQGLTRSLGCASQAVDKIYYIIHSSYSQYFRHYHSMKHLADVLGHLDEVRSELSDPRLVEYALWFHDIVCVPNADTNEYLSSAVACYAAAELGLPPGFGRQSADLILQTGHLRPAATSDGAYLTDSDLAVLGREWLSFLDYETQIRAEYQFLSEEEYRISRQQILERFLSLPAIYQTSYFRAKYEQSARRNLAALVSILKPSRRRRI